MAAFQDAIDLGYRYLETDVHVSRDGVLFAFHDRDLRRTCGIDALISDLTADELAVVRVSGTEAIPRLEEILTTWPEVRLNIDCKSDEALAPLVSFLRTSDVLERVCVGAFSDTRLRRLREEFGPRLCTSLGPREVAALAAASTTRFSRSTKTHVAHAAQVPVRQGPVPIVTATFVELCQARGMQVHVWTIDDPAEMARLLDMGVHGIMSDDTRALRQVLQARGTWV